MLTQMTLSLTEGRKSFFTMIDEVQKPGCYYTLTFNGKPKAVLLSAEEFESWRETMNILADPKVVSALRSADKDFKSGNYTGLEDLLNQEGYVLADKTQKKYGFPRKSKKRGRQKPRKNP